MPDQVDSLGVIEHRVQAIRRALLAIDAADFELIVRERADGPTVTLVARSIAKALPDDDRGAVKARDELEKLVVAFCQAVGEPIPVDAIERARQLRIAATGGRSDAPLANDENRRPKEG